METKIQNPFLARLRNSTYDRGTRAALRRYWSPTTRYLAYPPLGQLGALRDDRKAALAALYAEHPQHVPGLSLGKAALQLGDCNDGKHPFDPHFRRLLACDSLDDLTQQLYRTVKRLQSRGIGLDYELLYKHLNMWSNYSEDVKVRWAADFWQAPINPAENSAL
jgi:CRISPR type I-E-associated protein CasB/Cse2